MKVLNLRVADVAENRVVINDYSDVSQLNEVDKFNLNILVVDNYIEEQSISLKEAVDYCVDLLGEEFLEDEEVGVIEQFMQLCSESQQLYVINYDNEYQSNCLVVFGDVNDFHKFINQLK